MWHQRCQLQVQTQRRLESRSCPRDFSEWPDVCACFEKEPVAPRVVLTEEHLELNLNRWRKRNSKMTKDAFMTYHYDSALMFAAEVLSQDRGARLCQGLP